MDRYNFKLSVYGLERWTPLGAQHPGNFTMLAGKALCCARVCVRAIQHYVSSFPCVIMRDHRTCVYIVML